MVVSGGSSAVYVGRDETLTRGAVAEVDFLGTFAALVYYDSYIWHFSIPFSNSC